MSLYENTSVLDDLRYEFRYGSMATKLIMLNVGIFFMIRLIHLILYLFTAMPFSQFSDSYTSWFMAPAAFSNLLIQPWSVITYMFLHEGFWHLFFNMLILYIFGRIFTDLLGNRRTLPVYVLGGMAGFLFYILIFNFVPAFHNRVPDAYMLGASAGVMAVMWAAATLRPDYRIVLFIIGSVKIKYIALFFLAFDLITLAHENSGGHLAHLGGALFGFVFVKQLNAGTDWSKGFNGVVDQLIAWNPFKPKQLRAVHNKWKGAQKQADKNYKQHYTYNTASNKSSNDPTNSTTNSSFDPKQQQEIDAILDKIAESGYESLSKEEKEFLFKSSRD